MKILVTGTAGFIGSAVVEYLHNEGHDVIGVDNINDYYDVNLKLGRLERCGIQKEAVQDHKAAQSLQLSRYQFVKADITEKEFLLELFRNEKFDMVCHLAAQAGVRYSLENPDSYIQSNIVGMMNILEACRFNEVKHLVYASSSSVYGQTKEIPFSTKKSTVNPVSLYAATKKSNELMAHTYSHLFGIPTTGLRFFTVYGPWGRPDMAPFLFSDAISNDRPIKVFNHGKMKRDFTYIDDIVEGTCKILLQTPQRNPEWNGDLSGSWAPYKIYNIGNNTPVELGHFISTLEKYWRKDAKKKMMDMQPGDVPLTFADVSDLEKEIGYKPSTSLDDGIQKFVDWYRSFYNKS